MPLKVAFIGFRHGHIGSLYSMLSARDDAEIVAACEEDPEARAALEDSDIAITHDSYEDMLADVDCDVIACGDYYAIRGERLIAALERGRHVIGDKPLCTSLTELEFVQELAKRDNLRVGCMLDLVDGGAIQSLHRHIRSGIIGDVHLVHFDGKHPLNYGSRPGWYFEEGKQGGTINDLAIHAIDGIPWMTGRHFTEVTAARVWNARHHEVPFFQDGAVLMMRMDNNGAVTGDVSYLTPEGPGYTFPAYWRFCVTGSEGYIETSCTSKTVSIFLKTEKEPRVEPIDEPRPHQYWEDFLSDLDGAPNMLGLHTARIIHSSRVTLMAQRAADTGEFPAPVPPPDSEGVA